MFRVFLLDSFDGSNTYIVSPWITSFDFRKELIYSLYVSSRNSIEILEGLLERGVSVHLVMRSIDEALPETVFTILYGIY